MRNTPQYRGILYAIAAAALFGMSTPAAKVLLGDLSPLMLSALLYLGAAAALRAYPLNSREAPLTSGWLRSEAATRTLVSKKTGV